MPLQRASAAQTRVATDPRPYDEEKWGQVIAYLRESGVIDDREEQGVAGAYSFVSPGSHTRLSLSEAEMARLGRTLAASMCYFLVKAWLAAS